MCDRKEEKKGLERDRGQWRADEGIGGKMQKIDASGPTLTHAAKQGPRVVAKIGADSSSSSSNHHNRGVELKKQRNDDNKVNRHRNPSLMQTTPREHP